VISSDSHLELPPDDFLQFVPEAFRDRAPRRVQTSDGGDSWLAEGVPLVHTGPNLTAGEPVQMRGKSYWKEDGSRATGAGGPVQRLEEQDLDGVDAEILFPPIFVRDALKGISDIEAYLAIVQGYNTFLAESYCAVAPDRLVGNGVVPERGIDGAVAELKRCAELGLKSVCLTSFPNGGPLAAPEDDRFWEEALGLGMPVTAHTHMGHRYPPFVTGPQPGSPPDAGTLVSRQACLSPMWNVAQLIATGVFDRFPELRIYFAETNASWLPMALHQIDENYDIYAHIVSRKLTKPPSEYFREHVRVSFIMDPLVLKMIDLEPIECLMWGSDFPHSVGSFPHSEAFLDKAFEGVDPGTRRTILVENPALFFHLDASANLTDTPAEATGNR
jgi:predicted TIM-barrel fold metal-dependent hydrolase